MDRSLRGRTIFITGASRGIGLAIARRAARDGANVAIAAKTATPHHTLPGTIYTAAAEVEALGGRALPLVCDVRQEEQVEAAIARTVEEFGGLDVLVNNASAVRLTGVASTPLARFDLMHSVNVRGSLATLQRALPHLLRSEHAHVLSISPPLSSIEERWFAPHAPYSITKYGMSLLVLGAAAELRGRVAVNALWPRTVIDTAAMREIGRGLEIGALRSPEIIADAAWWILTSDPCAFSGRFFVDDEVLRAHGCDDLSRYAPPGVADLDLTPDLFVPSLRELAGGRDSPPG
ncbi:MAG: NAD(P)-dependent oxidoreductase [Steroidobacteraceae bacterium]|jgi:citronellol/citronellal dehydrogenase|nr:NAD(P)-dependent oxidoreductase [Steroidobacteraceae bacterium]